MTIGKESRVVERVDERSAKGRGRGIRVRVTLDATKPLTRYASLTLRSKKKCTLISSMNRCQCSAKYVDLLAMWLRGTETVSMKRRILSSSRRLLHRSSEKMSIGCRLVWVLQGVDQLQEVGYVREVMD